jgi:hypothetical protein
MGRGKFFQPAPGTTFEEAGMGNQQEKKGPDSSCEEVRIRNYLATEVTITKTRWFIIGFLLLYLNIIRLPSWPIGLFNSLLALAALYNLGIHL